MRKKTSIIAIVLAFMLLNIFNAVFAADNSNSSATDSQTVTPAKVRVPRASRPTMAGSPTPFNIISGTVSKIDTANPSDIKLEVKNDRDATMRAISVLPSTNITKITDISELKTGDTVRIMSRKVNDKDVAMNVVFGHIKSFPVRRPVKK